MEVLIKQEFVRGSHDDLKADATGPLAPGYAFGGREAYRMGRSLSFPRIGRVPGTSLAGRLARWGGVFMVLGMALLARAVPGGLEDGLLLYLPFTTDLRDHSPSNHPIKVVGDVRFEPEGAVFGGQDWLEAPHIPLNHRSFAFAFWMRDTTSEQSVGLVEQFDARGRRRHFHLVLRKNRQPLFGFYPGRLLSPLSVPASQEWVHLVFQYDGEEQGIWMNGRLIGARRILPYEGTNGVTTIGKIPRWRNVPGSNFQGYLRDFRVHARTLSMEEIQILATPRLEVAGNQTGVFGPALPGNRNAPFISPLALASRQAVEAGLSADASLPFLEFEDGMIVINGRAGQVYSLVATEDFNQWSILGQLTNHTGRLEHELSDAEAFSSKRFFRVRVEGFPP